MAYHRVDDFRSASRVGLRAFGGALAYQTASDLGQVGFSLDLDRTQQDQDSLPAQIEDRLGLSLGGTLYWGTGWGGRQVCSDCCYYCSGGESRIFNLVSGEGC